MTDTTGDSATKIAAEIKKGIGTDSSGFMSVVHEIQDYRSTHSISDFEKFYKDLNDELIHDKSLLPALLIAGHPDNEIEVHLITEELDKDLLLNSGSTKYDAIAKEVEQRYRDIVRQSASADFSTTQPEFSFIYESAKLISNRSVMLRDPSILQCSAILSWRIQGLLITLTRMI